MSILDNRTYYVGHFTFTPNRAGDTRDFMVLYADEPIGTFSTRQSVKSTYSHKNNEPYCYEIFEFPILDEEKIIVGSFKVTLFHLTRDPYNDLKENGFNKLKIDNIQIDLSKSDYIKKKFVSPREILTEKYQEITINIYGQVYTVRKGIARYNKNTINQTYYNSFLL